MLEFCWKDKAKPKMQFMSMDTSFMATLTALM